ncbi:MAG TPA: Flp pilus assembly protein CpaB [Gaiellaceae bacterium]|nr:Flp pilus assembly protein CpaB [Gaiellaceae bacterium]
MTYRVRNILIAVGLAVVAMLLTVFYVSNYKSNVRASSETISVLVAKTDIPQGTLGSQVVASKMLTTQEIPRKAFVNGTISKPEDVQGLIVTQPIYIGEQVTARRFGPLESAGVRDQLKGTYRAIQIKGNPNQILSGVLRPGDHIDVVASIKFPEEDSAKHFSKVILRDVLVLRTSGETDSTASVVDPTGGDGWVMLRLTDAQAQKLYFVYANNDWWLALRPGLNDANSPELASIDDAVSILREGLGRDQLKDRLGEGG